LNLAEKQAFVDKLSADVKSAQAFALVNFGALDAEKMASLRIGLRRKDVRVRVVKNTLARRVFKETANPDIAEDLVGPTMMFYSSGDPINAAKAFQEWLKKDGYEFKVKSGLAMGEKLSAAKIEALSKLPGREELFVGFLWALKSAPTKFLYALSDAPKRLGYAVAALKEKKEQEGK
jgi:large subunit ribosomal protein L10